MMYLGDKPVKAIARSKNNLLNIFGRTRFEDGAWSNTTIREFDETKYCVGLVVNNYWAANRVEVDFAGHLFVKSIALGYGIGFPVKCKPNTSYSISWESGTKKGRVGVGYYTGEGVFLSYVGGKQSAYTFTTPENCGWMTIVFSSDVKNETYEFYNIMLNEGSTALPYEPYNQLFTVPIKKCVGKNLFDISKLINTTVDGDYFKGAGADKSFYNLRVTPLRTYSVTFTVQTGNTGINGQLLMSVIAGKDESYYSGAKRLLLRLKPAGGEYSKTYKFTVPENVTWVSFSTIGHKFRPDNFMINEGDTALPYEPYTEWYEY